MHSAEKVKAMGCPVYAVDELAARACLEELLVKGDSGYCVAINAEKISRYNSDPNFRPIIDNSLFPYPDGAGATLAIKLLHKKKSQKINMPVICLEEAQRLEKSVFVYGAASEVHDLAVAQIRNSFPNLVLAGNCHGYTDLDVAREKILSSKPDLVLMALGSPKQENFAADFAYDANALFVGGGGALDIMAGVKKRAPKFFVDNGLEWAYRLAKEPWRWRRQFVLFKFVGELLVYKATGRTDH